MRVRIRPLGNQPEEMLFNVRPGNVRTSFWAATDQLTEEQISP